MYKEFKEAWEENLRELREDKDWLKKIGIIFLFIFLFYPFVFFIKKFSTSLEIIVFGTSAILIFSLMVMQRIKRKN